MCEHYGEETITQCEDEDEWARVQVEACYLRHFRAVRLGPFGSMPGQWRSLSTQPLQNLLVDGDRVSGFIGSAATEDGALIGFPPLHAHHIHVRKGDLHGGYNALSAASGASGLGFVTSREHASHWFEVHGDYPVGTDFGVGAKSARGYSTLLPAGHCYLVSSADDIDINAEINDVRIASADSSEVLQLDYYLLLAFTLSGDDSCRSVSKFWFRHPKSVVLTNDVWARYDVPRTPAVTWWSGVFPAEGRMLHAWLHTHRMRGAGFLLLASSPEQIPFQCDELGIDRADGTDTLAVRNITHTRLELSRRARVVCEDDRAVRLVGLEPTRPQPCAPEPSPYHAMVCARVHLMLVWAWLPRFSYVYGQNYSCPNACGEPQQQIQRTEICL